MLLNCYKLKKLFCLSKQSSCITLSHPVSKGNFRLAFQGEIKNFLQQGDKKIAVKGHPGIGLGIKDKGRKELPVADGKGLLKMLPAYLRFSAKQLWF